MCAESDMRYLKALVLMKATWKLNTPTGKTKSTHLPCSFENLMGKGLNGMEKLFVS